MKRRLDLAASFILRPRVLFLDEPTTGQDPRNRGELKALVGGTRIDVVVRRPGALGAAAAVLERASGAAVDADAIHRRVSAPASDGVPMLADILRGLEAAGVEAEDVGFRQPTLDEVFLTLTGAPAEPGAEREAVPA